MVKIWIDADACPKMIKDILFRTATRAQIDIVAVSNHLVPIPTSSFIKRIQVSGGFDVADQCIVDSMQAGDLVITADIPLANAVVQKGGLALNPRGEMYSNNNIMQRLGLRNVNESLRGSGQLTGGPAKLGSKDSMRFANQLDKWVTQQKKQGFV